MADDPASDELPRRWRTPVLAWAAAIAAIAVALAFQGQTWPLLHLLIPYPFFALIGAVLITEVAARLRRAPADIYVGQRLVRLWWTWRLALIVAGAFLLVASGVAALTGVPVALALFQAFIIVTMLSATISLAAQCVINVVRVIRGPAGAES